eukprot:5723964-Prymnesium_polylepis.1
MTTPLRSWLSLAGAARTGGERRAWGVITFVTWRAVVGGHATGCACAVSSGCKGESRARTSQGRGSWRATSSATRRRMRCAGRAKADPPARSCRSQRTRAAREPRPRRLEARLVTNGAILYHICLWRQPGEPFLSHQRRLEALQADVPVDVVIGARRPGRVEVACVVGDRGHECGEQREPTHRYEAGDGGGREAAGPLCHSTPALSAAISKYTNTHHFIHTRRRPGPPPRIGTRYTTRVGRGRIYRFTRRRGQ